ncbi:FxDxF family PEP-CTERM protein [Sphingomonas quercus]|uniref:FxDxF family PEP-CTERM protein n=1 Tax=Sphingomonas quercus TaxID=2842451 RepID=A0ABS6BM76_9SPHN|nr:FxDxF family PEP-CTERM protein [Sphingomonas quercus]MBU3078486.1 FxDxF family PEP-CTERM protein [Sphingomonas quercus]
MKTFLYVASALAATAAMAAPASATDFNLTLVSTGSGATTGVSNTVTEGEFTDTFTFFYDFNGWASGSFTNNIIGGRNIDFISIMLNGVSGLIENLPGGTSRATFDNVFFQSGEQTLVIKGTSFGGASSYGGDIQIENAVPEPATWAMMLLGFGLVGAGARGRRRNAAQVTA